MKRLDGFTLTVCSVAHASLVSRVQTRRLTVAWDANGASAYKLGACERSKKARLGELLCHVREETIEFRLENPIALTGPGLQTRAIEHCDLASPVTDQPDVLSPSFIGTNSSRDPSRS
jgi:hypothetical protein